jgi:O-antigen ligase
MNKTTLSFQSDKFQENITLFANHLLVIFAFLAPTTYDRGNSAIIIILIALFIIRGNYLYYIKESLSNRLVQAFLIYVFVHVVWLIGTDTLENAIIGFKLVKYLIYPFLFTLFLDKNFITKIITAFILGMLLSELMSYLMHFHIIPYQLEILNTIVYKAQDIGNPTPFINHAFYNTFLSIVIGILLYNLLENKNTILTKIISIFFITTASINITLVGGRAGYLAFIAIILVTLILVYRKRFFKIALPIAIVVISIFFYLTYNNSDMFQKRIADAIKDKNELLKDNPNYNTSVGLRLGFWKYSLEVIKDNPLFGVGTGDVMSEVRSRFKEEHKYINHLVHPHNEYLKNILSFGFIGFFAFLYILYQVFKIAGKEDRNLQTIAIIILTGFMVLMLTEVLGKKLWIVFTILTTVLTVKASYIQNKNLEMTLNSFFVYLIGIILFIIVDLLQ